MVPQLLGSGPLMLTHVPCQALVEVNNKGHSLAKVGEATVWFRMNVSQS